MVLRDGLEFRAMSPELWLVMQGLQGLHRFQTLKPAFLNLHTIFYDGINRELEKAMAPFFLYLYTSHF